MNAHPSPSSMAAMIYGTGDTGRACARGVTAERHRLAALLLARSQAAAERASAVKGETASSAWALAMHEAEVLSDLATELLP